MIYRGSLMVEHQLTSKPSGRNPEKTEKLTEIWRAMPSAVGGPLCIIKSEISSTIYQEILEPFIFPSADKQYGDANFIFGQDLAFVHITKITSNYFKDKDIKNAIKKWLTKSH